jgi:HPt (histidine-containing phosphotransfer) domain-containing protein
MAGVDGEIPLVARENATKLEIDAEGTDADLTGVAVEDDFGGRLYDAPVSGRDAVYVHRGGAYTTEVRDSDGALGAFRVNPGEESSVRIDRPRTGKASLAMFLANISEETAEELSELEDDDDIGGGSVNAIGGLAQALSSVGAAARRAAEQAESGNRGAADRNIDSVISLLEQVETRLEGARGSLPDDIARAVELRLEQARRRSEQAKAEEKL